MPLSVSTPASQASPGHRVKVYRLNEQGTWDDLGTGHVNVYGELAVGDDQLVSLGGGGVSSRLKIVVHSESDRSKQLLFHTIEEGVTYNRQGDDTIITWNDLYIKTDIALSFQEPSGCQNIWNQIQSATMTMMRTARTKADQRGGLDEDDIVDRHAEQQLFGSLASGQPFLNTNLVLRDGVNVGGGNHLGLHREGDGVDVGLQQGGHLNEDDYFNAGYEPHHMHHHASMSQVCLPETPTLDNLATIATIVTESTLFQREGIAQQLLVPGYLKAILDAFEMAEDLEDGDGVKAGHLVVKGAIMLNDVNLLEVLFSDECIVQMVGALEYGDGLEMGAARGRHRNFVQGDMNLKEVVPITDAISRAKIIQAHRILYVRDTILPKSLDDSTFSTLSSMYLFNIVEVLLVLHQDASFFKNLFDRIHKAERGTEDWRDLISFLQELITLSRHIQMAQRNDILMRLSRLGLFQVMSDSLRTDDTDAKLRAVDAILATVVHDPVLLRSHIQNKEDGHVIFEQLISVLLQSGSSGLQEQALDVIKILLDPDTMDSAEMKDKFCGMFYDNHVTGLIEALARGTPAELERRKREREEKAAADHPTTALAEEPPPSVSSLLLIVDLLSYCISQHSYRIKYCILRSNAVETVLELMERPEKALVGAALRLLKTCVMMKDEFYVRYMLQKNIMDRVLEAYLRFCRKENLIHSALLDLLDLLRRENNQSLLSACVSSSLWEQVEMVECDQEITMAVRMKHESNLTNTFAEKGAFVVDDGAARVADALANEQRRLRLHQARRVSVDDVVHADSGAGTTSDVGTGGLHPLDPEIRAAAAAEARRLKGEFAPDVDEENYFNDDGEDGDDESGGIANVADMAGAAEGPPRKTIVLRDEDVVDQDGMPPLQRLVEYESDDDDDTIPLSAGIKRKSAVQIRLNLGGVKIQKIDGIDGDGEHPNGTSGDQEKGDN